MRSFAVSADAGATAIIKARSATPDTARNRIFCIPSPIRCLRPQDADTANLSCVNLYV